MSPPLPFPPAMPSDPAPPPQPQVWLEQMIWIAAEAGRPEGRRLPRPLLRATVDGVRLPREQPADKAVPVSRSARCPEGAPAAVVRTNSSYLGGEANTDYIGYTALNTVAEAISEPSPGFRMRSPS